MISLQCFQDGGIVLSWFPKESMVMAVLYFRKKLNMLEGKCY